MRTFPNAKINLGLHVVSKRADGYHSLETILYPVSIKDSIEIEDGENTSCTITGMSIPGNPENNICISAFRLFAASHNILPQIIFLEKNIPVGAGLGGGSADAAFLLKMLNEKFETGLTENELEAYARKLGADCAFFIKNKPVLARARGDEFSPVKVDLSGYKIHLVKPPVHISTADAFAYIKPAKPAMDLQEVISMPVEMWKDHLVNDFEAPVFRKHPQIALLKESLYDQGALFAQMSGSGSSVFGIFSRAEKLSVPEDHQAFYNI